jgi:phage major head subunit gpT-like protein
MLIPQFAAAAKKHPDLLLISDVFNAAGGNGPTCFDGGAFWRAVGSPHPAYGANGTTFANDFDLTCTESTLLQELAENVIAPMRTIKGANGIIMQNKIDTFIVPPQQEFRFRRALESITVPYQNGAEGNNPFKGQYKLIVIDELGSAGDRIYAANMGSAIKPFIWQVRSNPIFRAFDTGTEEHAFDRNVFRYGVDGDDGGPYRGNVGVTLPHLCARIDLTVNADT